MQYFAILWNRLIVIITGLTPDNEYMVKRFFDTTLEIYKCQLRHIICDVIGHILLPLI